MSDTLDLRHPGEVIRELWMDPVGMSIDEAARILNIESDAMCDLLDGKMDLTDDMAYIIAKETGTAKWCWNKKQTDYDIWKNRKG